MDGQNSNFESDDLIVPFAIEQADVRGRIACLGPAIDEILSRHAYPDKVSELLGQALLLVAMFGSMIKDRQTSASAGSSKAAQASSERLILQTQSDGPINLLVADYVHPGHLRGYARFDKKAVEDAGPSAALSALLGEGHLAMTIDRGTQTDRYQGIVALGGDGENGSLSEGLAGAANKYFEQSEQLPTFIQLAIARHFDATKKDDAPVNDGWHWRGGALMVQKLTSVGGHETAVRNHDDDGWNRTLILSQSIKDHELLDPLLKSPDLLFRLYHEDKVRVFDSASIKAACSCSLEGVTNMLASFSKSDQSEMIEEDGKVHITCEFCNRSYELTP